MEPLLYTCQDGIATLTLNRPEAKNALSDVLAKALDERMVQIARDAEVRVLIITGAGGAFCAGGDVRGMSTTERTPEQRRDRMRSLHRLVHAMHALDKPIIAAVDGVAYGAGFSMALLCDIVLASERARFCMAFNRIGLVPDYGALYTLPRIVGMQRAKEILYSARELSATEAVQLGIALETVPADGLMARAQTLALAFTSASPMALSLTKDALNASLGSSLDMVLQMEAAAQAIAGSSDYHREAARRFVAKEPMQFQWPKAGG